MTDYERYGLPADVDFELEFFKLLEQHPEIHVKVMPEPEVMVDVMKGRQVVALPDGRLVLVLPLTPEMPRLLFEAIEHLEHHACFESQQVVERWVAYTHDVLTKALAAFPHLIEGGMSMDEFTRKLAEEGGQ